MTNVVDATGAGTAGEGAASERERAHDGLEQTRELLTAYDAALQSADGLPHVIWMRRSSATKRIPVPRFRWFLRPFLVYHIARSLTRMKQHHQRTSALRDEADADACLRAISSFESSLPPKPSRLSLSVFLFVVFVTALGLATLLTETRAASQPLAGITEAMLTLDPPQVLEAAKQYDTLESVVVTFLALSFSLYLVLFIPMSSFRLKRAIFNLYPHASVEALRSASATDHVFRAQGVYEIEDETFGRRGLRRPQEVRYDLVVEAVVAAFAVCVGIVLGAGIVDGAGVELAATLTAGQQLLGSDPKLAIAAGILLTLSAMRLAYLARMWRRRRVVATPASAFDIAGFDADSRALAVALASWRRRAVAWLLDAVIVTVLWFILVIVWVATATDPESEATNADILVMFIFAPAAAVLVNVILLARRGRRNGQTLGKRLFGIRVVPENGGEIRFPRALVRELVGKTLLFGCAGLLLAAIPTLANYLWPLLDDDNQALHDRFADTRVVRA